ncbi:MAG: PEP/pyruvate-binding domain-containing protein [Hyphomicrobiales bacterium]
MEIVRIEKGSTERHSVESVGSKAAAIARMAALGLPVPFGFVLPIELCAAIIGEEARAERELTEGLHAGIAFLESAVGKRFGDRRRPLLVSVRSGAAQSMPGMLDTVLNVGCTSVAVGGLLRMTGNPRFAWDCRRRFLEDYAQTVLGADPQPFAARLGEMVVDEAVASDRDLDSEALERLACDYQGLLEDHGARLPDDPFEQLLEAARAVYRSWTSERARTYRRLHDLEHLQGTAVFVQAMVFGNRGLSSGAGVAFSRDPSTGAKRRVLDMLFDAQGEDVVSGRRTPDSEETLAQSLPEIAAELNEILTRLEREFGDVQDVEFTIEDAKLWILQTRAAQRTPRAALRIAIDLVHEGLISRKVALRRVDGIGLEALAKTRFADAGAAACRGIGASTGVAVGRAAFDSASAERLARSGEPVILLRPDVSTADIGGFSASVGIVTARGGRTAHAALVARQMGKPCVVGCQGLVVEAGMRRALLADASISEGDWVSVDAEGGDIYLGRLEVIVERPQAEFAEIERWRASPD